MLPAARPTDRTRPPRKCSTPFSHRKISGGWLQLAAKSVLPLAGGLGGFVGGPLGAKIGSGLASCAGGAPGSRDRRKAGLPRKSSIGSGGGRNGATDRDLEKCRQLFEKHRQFVRMAGKAATAAASAPTGVNPTAVAQKILADSALEKLTRKATSAGRAGNFAEGAQAAATMKTAAAAGRAAGQKSRTGTQAPSGQTCSICELPPGSCHCRKISRSGRWFRAAAVSSSIARGWSGHISLAESSRRTVSRTN